MIYKLYTEGLPNNQVIGHALIAVNGKEWSYAHVCANKSEASNYIEEAIAKWAKMELDHYANQRKLAFVNKGVFNSTAQDHYNNIKRITRTLNTAITWRSIIELKESINYFLPHKDSIHAGWLPVIAQVNLYASSNITQLKQSA